MVQTRRQAALALAAAPAADAIVRAPRKPRAAKSSAETAKLAVESLLPPEIYLMIMEVLIAQKKLKTLLEFSVASKQCADLGLSILKRYPRRSVWVALAESDEYDIIELGPFPNNDDEVVAVCSSYQGARAALREEFVDLDFPALHFDFGDSAILSICEFLVLGPLEPANHVWLRFRTDPVEYEEYGSEECRLDGVFATEVEARATAEDAAESDDVSDISCDCPNCYPLKPYYSYEKYMIKD